MTPALAVIIGVFVLVIGLGLAARRGHEMSLEQWSVGGRGFGTVFVFLLMAGEIYTTFTFLGGSGWAYGKGAPAFYILCYGAIAYSVSYFLLPIVWRFAQGRTLVSQADFFAVKYDSQPLGVVVAIVGVAALVPYLVLQLKGLGIIVSEASGGVVTQQVAIWTGSAALVAYVIVSGVRGSAWTGALKDVMILVVVVWLGVYLPMHYYGGYRAMFEAVETAKPGTLTLPSSGMSSAWFVSTVLLTATGFYMWPQFFSGVYTARNENVFRKNAVILPLYQLILLFVFFVGFAAILVVPGLKGADADLSLLRVVERSFGSWTVGIIGAAGILTALVPGSMLLVTAGTILAQNVYRVITPTASDRTVAIVARSLVPLIALVSVLMTLRGGATLVVMLLMGYSIVTQLFPGLILCLGKNPRVSSASVIAGIVAGELTVVFLTVTSATVATLLPAAPQMVKDLNVGFIALGVNAIVLCAVALVTRAAIVAAA